MTKFIRLTALVLALLCLPYGHRATAGTCAITACALGCYVPSDSSCSKYYKDLKDKGIAVSCTDSSGHAGVCAVVNVDPPK